MAAVLSGFAVVWLIIAVGYLLGRINVLGPEARVVLSRVAFFVASPCLLFITISESSIREVLGPQFAVAGLSAFAMLGLFLLFGRFFLRGRSGADVVIGGMSASLVIMFQLALYTPVYVGLLDQLTAGRGTTTRVRPRASVEVFRRLAQTLGNPMIVGCALGLLFSWQNWRLPEQIHDSVELLAGASIPLMLLAFGLSLVGSYPLEKASGRRRDVLIAVALKLVLHPLLAYVIAAFVFRLDGLMLLAAVVMASLPTAQNVLVAAVRYGTGETIARDTVLVTTVLGIPSMVAVALILA